MPRKMITPLVVWLDGDDVPCEVSSDQRDLARWEAHDDYNPAGTHTAARFVAWSALRRTERYTGTWKQFNEVDCLEVESLVTAADGEGEQGLDPGNQSTDATTSSSW